MELHVEAFWSVDGNGYRKYPKVGESVWGFLKLTEGYQCFMKEAVMEVTKQLCITGQTIRYVDLTVRIVGNVIEEIFADFYNNEGSSRRFEYKEAIFLVDFELLAEKAFIGNEILQLVKKGQNRWFFELKLDMFKIIFLYIGLMTINYWIFNDFIKSSFFSMLGLMLYCWFIDPIMSNRRYKRKSERNTYTTTLDI